MLVLHGDSKSVSCTRYGDREVWTSGIRTPYNVLKPYMGTTILHLRDENDLAEIRWNLRGVYVICSGSQSLAADVVRLGGYCIRDSFSQGLYRLRNI